ncbi:hypothetical protein [Actinomadura physcomitrii]|uniref:hypothetical protein n=1 Tax=Actinomadura physcomitrii TaxID=2650748 RepID=UPI0019232BA6|nr:hypothetical protein [Actinomadura physcomitrii]
MAGNERGEQRRRDHEQPALPEGHHRRWFTADPSDSRSANARCRNGPITGFGCRRLDGPRRDQRRQ